MRVLLKKDEELVIADESIIKSICYLFKTSPNNPNQISDRIPCSLNARILNKFCCTPTMMVQRIPPTTYYSLTSLADQYRLMPT